MLAAGAERHRREEPATKEAQPHKSAPVHSVTLKEACLLPGTSRREPRGTTQEATS